MGKRPLGITLTGGSSIFFGVLMVLYLILNWGNLVGQYTFVMVFLLTIVFLLFGGGLIAAGVGIFKFKKWGRWLLIGICGFLLFLLAIDVASSASKPDALNARSILILLGPLTLFLSPIIYLTRPIVREYFGVEE